MLMASWWVARPNFDVDMFLADLDFMPDDVWHCGEQPKWTTSGFRVEFESEVSFDDLLSTIKESLLEIKPVIEALHQKDMISTLTIAFSVGGEKIYARSINFPSDFLSLLAELRIELQISAFPTSDD